jgi:hypothetical protein
VANTLKNYNVTNLDMQFNVFIITAECGESQYSKLCERLRNQVGVTIHHEVISNQTSTIAERMIFEAALYAKKQQVFDWILRVDADMIPVTDTSIRDILQLANNYSIGPRITTPVLDYYTGCPIYGLHAIKPESVPESIDQESVYLDKWFTDIPGTNLSKEKSNCFFTHGFKPSLQQAVRFGLTRGTKAKLRGPRDVHWITLDALRRNVIRNPDDTMIWMIYLAGIVGTGIFDEFPVRWENIDISDPMNAQIVSFVDSNKHNLKLKRTYLSFKDLLFLHFKVHGSLFESLRTGIKIIFRR